jgi:hypothetical protein
MMPATAVITPNPCNFVILSFRKTIANVMVTMDKAEAMSVIRIASPMVKPLDRERCLRFGYKPYFR